MSPFRGSAAPARRDGDAPLQGRVCVVTGANRGIGRAIAERFAAAGGHVVLAVRNPAGAADAARAVAAAGGRDPDVLECDVADDGSVARFAAELERRHPAGVHVLVNNAAVMEDERWDAATIPIDVFRRHLEVNLVGALRVSRAVIPLMQRARWGRIVNLTSGMGRFDGGLAGGHPAYRVSKAALNALSKTMARDVQGMGVKVNVLDPGWVRTRMGGDRAPLDPRVPAEHALTLAALPDDGPSGTIWRDGRQVTW
ncbi:MAG TPA: SDR family NAD(P)-dependent oxidoreductase [Gemmatimonadota bacterium]|jgi:NAD(P)-dependent dehydrogenase (short-subunit alcohol dehydrogenase family)